jgi:hypothetical protein
VHNLSGSVGIAVASAFAVGILASSIATSAAEHPEISDELIAQVNINEVNFVTNEALAELLATRASGPELDAAIAVNAEARLHSLKISLLSLAAISLLAIVPATRMPRQRAGDLPEKLEPDDDDLIDPVDEQEALG